MAGKVIRIPEECTAFEVENTSSEVWEIVPPRTTDPRAVVRLQPGKAIAWSVEPRVTITRLRVGMQRQQASRVIVPDGTVNPGSLRNRDD